MNFTLITRDGAQHDAHGEEIAVSIEQLWAGQDIPQGRWVLDVPEDRDPLDLRPWFDKIFRIEFVMPVFSDGRVFSRVRRLRAAGYSGRIRIVGPMIQDQWCAAIRVGVDEVALPEDHAERQKAATWQVTPRPSYQDRLMA